MTDPTPVAAPSTSAIVAALAASLLPFVGGPVGLAASALVPAVQQLYDTFTNHPTGTVSVDDLVKLILGDNVAILAKLKADTAALP